MSSKVVLRVALAAGLLLSVACRTSPSEPATAGSAEPTPGSGAAAEGTAAEGTATEGSAAPATDGSAPANEAAEGSIASSGICPMIPEPGGSGAMTCPPECVLVKGAPIVEDIGCALIGPRYEVAMGCVGFPVQTREPGACWTNPAGIHVVTAFTFPDLLRAGWELCPEEYPFRQASPCTAEQLQANEAAAAAGAPRLRLAADGSVITDGSGTP